MDKEQKRLAKQREKEAQRAAKELEKQQKLAAKDQARRAREQAKAAAKAPVGQGGPPGSDGGVGHGGASGSVGAAAVDEGLLPVGSGSGTHSMVAQPGSGQADAAGPAFPRLGVTLATGFLESFRRRLVYSIRDYPYKMH